MRILLIGAEIRWFGLDRVFAGLGIRILWVGKSGKPKSRSPSGMTTRKATATTEVS